MEVETKVPASQFSVAMLLPLPHTVFGREDFLFQCISSTSMFGVALVLGQYSVIFSPD